MSTEDELKMLRADLSLCVEYVRAIAGEMGILERLRLAELKHKQSVSQIEGSSIWPMNGHDRHDTDADEITNRSMHLDDSDGEEHA